MQIEKYFDQNPEGIPISKVWDARQKICIKVPISSKFLFSHLILYFMQWAAAKTFFDLDKKRFFTKF